MPQHCRMPVLAAAVSLEAVLWGLVEVTAQVWRTDLDAAFRVEKVLGNDLQALLG